MKKPVIGILLNHETSGSFSDMPHYALRDHYFKAVEKAGGIPVGLGYLKDSTDYFDLIQGLLSPGGNFASPAEWYVDDSISPYAPSVRLQADLNMIEKALDRNMPILGICAGMQLLSGLSGSKMTGNLTRHFQKAADHRRLPATKISHTVTVMPGTKLHAALNTALLPVNSRHQEAVVTPGKNIIVSARSDDGIIEAIELKDHPFAVGVQWHPEVPVMKNDPSAKIFKSLISHAAGYRP